MQVVVLKMGKKPFRETLMILMTPIFQRSAVAYVFPKFHPIGSLCFLLHIRFPDALGLHRLWADFIFDVPMKLDRVQWYNFQAISLIKIFVILFACVKINFLAAT